MKITGVDICCGLAWGDEAKGKIVSELAKTNRYDFVCRWAGGNNAGHTVFVDGIKFKTHLIPSGVFYNIPSIIGPDCVVNKDAFFTLVFNSSLNRPRVNVLGDWMGTMHSTVVE